MRTHPAQRFPVLAGCLATAMAVLASGPVQAETMTIRSGHAGHWFAADRSGEGWVLELRDAGDAWLYWFTYDGQGRQRWLTAAGQIVDDGNDGQRIDFAQLVVTRGARFGDAFDPDDVEREAVGSASFSFDGCDSGQFSYEAFGQSQTFDVQRLARVMGARCETPHGVTGREIADHAGQSGSWYDPTHNGEGYALHWATPDQAIVTWYSYDDEGEQYWMLGTGQLDSEGRIHFPDVHATRGARFGAAFDPDDVERFEWGTLTFELACDGGSANYQSVLPAFGSGDFDLTRLTSLHEVACPWQRPKLTELYDITLSALPTSIEGAPDAVSRARFAEMADDGTIWSVEAIEDVAHYRVVRLDPGADAWEVVGNLGVQMGSLGSVLHVRQGKVFTNGLLDESDDPQAMMWNGEEWLPLVESSDLLSMISGVSADGGVVVGYEQAEGQRPSNAWLWDSENGTASLPPDPIHSSTKIPLFASDDGSRIIGQQPVFPRPSISSHTAYASLWQDGEAPTSLGAVGDWRLALPRACGADCTVVFGTAASDSRPSPPRPRYEPWYWTADGRAAFLGRLSEASGHRYLIAGAAVDGNLVAGSYGGFPTFSAGSAAGAKATLSSRPRDGFVWTAYTGMVSVDAILGEIGVDLADWEEILVAAVSPDGRRIILVGNRPGAAPPGLALLELAPHADW